MGRIGKRTLVYDQPVGILSRASFAGPKEGQGPLQDQFDVILPDDLLGQKSWEFAECEMLRRTLTLCLERAGVGVNDLGVLIAGDLNNQIIASGFCARALGVPFLGMYGACSTMLESILVGAALVSSGFAVNALCAASSHFCSAERQFRFPLELGTQRPPSAQWTATAAGAALLAPGVGEGLLVTHGTLGRVVDMDVKDANHMGAAMAPAVADTLAAHLEDTGRTPDDYDLIATGDLGAIGRALLLELMQRRDVNLNEEKLVDCGDMLFGADQDAHAGGSGCGCVASVGCGYLMNRVKAGEVNRLLLIGSGAMLSPTSSQQGESIPGVAYACAIEGGHENG